ncbi:3-ketoacyl-ACP reductase [Chitinophaga polysaccharea]|uniref:3-ketoacyl-ACP reductase n=1 Tax=Chitinophaga polysaccharea TaxID=1293035 RepID=UPI001454FC73|nr:3-ketoacyl-ACP reductase [Chitinophaga polysaccharea]NLR58580.1 3-ketoacyl-ACP reductase [Chitinophaga polysaccharea]
MESLKGKKALITGGGKGIGRALAIALAKEGVDIALIGRTAGSLEAVAKEVQANGVKAAYAVADVSDMAAVDTAVASLTKELGGIDILINNAGIAAFGGFLELTPTQWEQIIQVNLMVTYYVTRAVLPEMIARKAGDIINIASTAGQRGAPATSAYSASKFGLLGLTESLMLEVRKHNIRVSALTPSTIATDMAKNLQLTDGNPEKVLQPEDLAELVVAQLKLNRRVLLKSAGLWSTNP